MQNIYLSVHVVKYRAPLRGNCVFHSSESIFYFTKHILHIIYDIVFNIYIQDIFYKAYFTKHNLHIYYIIYYILAYFTLLIFYFNLFYFSLCPILFYNVPLSSTLSQ